jgi:hypothetical protein
MKNFVLLTLTVFVFSSCATTSENKVQEIETKMEVKGQVSGGKLGIDDEGDAVIQQDNMADDELRTQIMVNSRLGEELKTEHFMLQSCRDDMSDPRLGGHGEPEEIPEIDKMKNATDVREQFGLDDDGNLRFVKREYYIERLKNERKYETSVRQMLKTVKRHRLLCEKKMSIARNRAGLPGDRYTADGYFTSNGTWVETRKAEQTLDDAFEISAIEKNKSER